MLTLGIYIYNSDRNAWLQADEKSWGPFADAVEFTEGQEEYAESIREREAEKSDDTTFTMVALT